MGDNFVTRLCVETPKGILVATPTEDKEFPGITITLVDKNGEASPLVLVENNGVNGHLRGVIWDSTNSDNDEPIAILCFDKDRKEQ